jgi:hypothetical protein
LSHSHLDRRLGMVMHLHSQSRHLGCSLLHQLIQDKSELSQPISTMRCRCVHMQRFSVSSFFTTMTSTSKPRMGSIVAGTS